MCFTKKKKKKQVKTGHRRSAAGETAAAAATADLIFPSGGGVGKGGLGARRRLATLDFIYIHKSQYTEPACAGGLYICERLLLGWRVQESGERLVDEFPSADQCVADVSGSLAPLAEPTASDFSREIFPGLFECSSDSAYRGHVLLAPLSGFPRLVHSLFHEETGSD